MARLTHEHRRFIVQRLACFESPSEVADGLRERFGIEIPRQQVYGYDPSAADRTGRRVAREWHELFWATRRRYLAEAAGIGIANRVYRLRRLDVMARKAERQGNLKLAAALLEQAAREMGSANVDSAPIRTLPRT